MSQLSALGLQAAVWTPVDLNRHVRQLIENDYRMGDLWVAGEVSNLSNPNSGHLYFSLRDVEAAVRCVMWKPDVLRLPRLPKDGEAIEVHGHVSVYEAGGQYQLYGDQVRFTGEGRLYQEYVRLKSRLEAEGLFDPERKRPLPAWPSKIGIVTSPTGAALRDVLNVLGRRYPLVEAILSPTPVQGEAAPGQIVKAIWAANELADPDLILLVRGGGSIEDLWAFNDERVVRAVTESPVPVVTGIGHATDVLLSDFAADLRAPTPSAAAELVTPDVTELAIELGELNAGLGRAMIEKTRTLRFGLGEQRAALALLSPRARVDNGRQRVDELVHRAAAAVRQKLSLQQSALSGLRQTLQAVGPETVLARGYAVVRKSADRAIVRSVGQVNAGDALEVRVSDGSFEAEAKPGV